MVDVAELDNRLCSAIADVRLLDHCFYTRWEAGELSTVELQAYAGQYRHFEAFLPSFLQRVASSLPQGSARDFVEANLRDESGTNGSPAHLTLFDDFLSATGGDQAQASPAMTALIEAYAVEEAGGSASALGALAAYEIQASSVAASKAEGLVKHYGFDSAGTAFWDVHTEADVQHGQWALSALAEVTDDVDMACASTRRVAEAWWAFLDEREELASASV